MPVCVLSPGESALENDRPPAFRPGRETSRRRTLHAAVRVVDPVLAAGIRKRDMPQSRSGQTVFIERLTDQPPQPGEERTRSEALAVQRDAQSPTRSSPAHRPDGRKLRVHRDREGRSSCALLRAPSGQAGSSGSASPSPDPGQNGQPPFVARGCSPARRTVSSSGRVRLGRRRQKLARKPSRRQQSGHRQRGLAGARITATSPGREPALSQEFWSGNPGSPDGPGQKRLSSSPTRASGVC